MYCMCDMSSCCSQELSIKLFLGVFIRVSYTSVVNVITLSSIRNVVPSGTVP